MTLFILQISSSTYKDRSEEYKRQFTHLPDSEKLIAGKKRHFEGGNLFFASLSK